jgi:antitoxin VapB
MPHTKLFKNGNSQAVRIPAELAFGNWDIELEIERHGDELRIRPAARRIGDVLAALGRFSPDFMAQGRGDQEQAEREQL